ncbi:L10-interacting MYB domain-containing protein-like isoform X2 [Papaver somniferum]|nr:L10-interacting MYB domain-containing protein-like isoform X2 [Papaver somniferum]XP_026432962.1 L10-interacting MYB domain-containing protein-like isoform X2 [Papaver somniferum]
MASLSSDDNVDDIRTWPQYIVDYFVQLVHDEAKNGLQTTTLEKKKWGEIDNALFAKFGKRYSIPKLKAKFNRLRIEHREFARLVSDTGMGWDPVANTVTASDDAWKRYLKKYPGAKSFRKKGLDNYYMLGEIFNSTTASGSMSNASTRSPPDSDTERDLETEFLGKGVHVEPASSGDTSHPSSHTQSNIQRRALDLPIDLPQRKATKSSRFDDALVAWTENLKVKAEVTKAKAERKKDKEVTSPLCTSTEISSIEDCMDILDNMEGVEDDVYLKAIDKFRNPDYRRIFKKMKESRRIMWLKSL